VTIPSNYLDPAGTPGTWSEAVALWTRGAQAVAGQVQQPVRLLHPRAPGMCEWVEFAHELQELNLDYLTGLIRAATIAREAASAHLDGLAGAVGHQVGTLAQTVGRNGHPNGA
jgi:hypothetical protein